MFFSEVPVRVRRAALLLFILSTLHFLPNSAYAQSGSVTLAWDPSTDPSVVGYNIYYGAASRTYTNMVSVGNATNVTITGLVYGVTYYFAATTYDAAGLESDYSAEITYSVPFPNQPPTINPIANLTTNENAGLQVVKFNGITSGNTNQSQTITITASSSNTGVIPNPTVTYTSPNTNGTLSFTPVAYSFGSSTITITVNNGGASNNITSTTFTVTVNSVNQPPTLNTLSNLTIAENATLQTVNLSGISSGATNEPQTLTVTASSSNTAVIPTPTVNYLSPNTTGSLTFTPVNDAFGSATITVTVNDGGTSNNIISRSFTVTVSPVNQPPTLNPIASVTIAENGGSQTVNLGGITSGAANENQTLTVTASSSNPGLIPNPTVTYTSPNTNGTLKFTPALNGFGSSTITVTVNDGGTSNNIVAQTFTVTVFPVNQPPTLNSITNVTINENATQQIVNLSGISSGATNENQTLTVTASSSNTGLIPNPTVNYTSPASAGTLTFTPVTYASGSATITVTVNDGGTSNNIISRTFTVIVNPVNQPPTLDPLSAITVLENSGPQIINLTGISSGAPNENQTLTVTASSSSPGLIPTPVINYVSPNTTGTLTFTPASNGVGSATITVTVNDGGTSNNIVTRSFSVTVGPVNQPPTLNPIANVAINENASQQIVGLTGISSGATNEVQTLTVTASSSNPALIPNPSINYTSPNATGTLTFTPVQYGFGSSTITVTVNDGGASNNITSQTFVVTVNPVNQPPTLDAINGVSIAENTGMQTVNLTGITSGAPNEAQNLTITATSSNPGLIPTPAVSYTTPNTTGSLSFTPAANAFGSANITVTVNDGGTSNNITSRTFTITVSPVNQPPTLNPIAGVTIAENAGSQTVNLNGISSGATNEIQTLTVTASSSNPALIPNPTITYTSPSTNGTLKFTPALNGFGSSIITVTVNDGGTSNNLVSQTFTVTVYPVNQPPTLNQISNITLNENATQQTVNLSGISSGATNENQTLTVTASSSNTGLIPNPTVNYTSPGSTGILSFTPVTYAYGLATITVTVNDGGTSNNIISQTFTVTVNPVNQQPTLDPLSAVTVLENSGPQIINLTGISSGAPNENQTLTVTASSSSPGLIPAPVINYTSPNNSGTLTFTPALNAVGSATITVTVNDGGTSNNIVSRSFSVTVGPVNQPPTLNPIANLTINENAGLQTVNLAGISSGATNEVQTLTVTSSSSNPSLIPNPTVNYTSPNATGTLTFTPVQYGSGASTITVTVNDGGASNNITSQTFVVTVSPVNQPPTLDPISNISIVENAGTQTVNLTGITSGATNEVQNLTITTSSSNAGLIPTPIVNYTSPNTTGNLSFTPTANAAGSSLITVTVNDGGTSNNIITRSFTVTVDQPPTISGLTNLVIAMNSQTPPLPFTIGDAETAAANLALTANSSDTTIVPLPNIVFGGSGSNRTILVTPSANATGSVYIAVSVSDGLASATNSFQLTVLPKPNPPTNLHILVSGSGTLSPNLASQNLVPGKTYTVTATPGTDQEFAGWSGSVNSTQSKITFTVTSNFVLQAIFVPTPFKNKLGAYTGLFFDTNQLQQQSSGTFSLLPTKHGVYTGKLQIGNTRYSIHGKFNLQSQTTNTIVRRGLPNLTVELTLGGGPQADQVFGRVTDGTFSAQLLGDRFLFNTLTNPSPWNGTYTMILPGQPEDPSLPFGNGFASVKIASSGQVRLVGTTPDGTKLTQSAPLSKHGSWPLYVSLYSGNGSVLSWIALTNRTTDDLNGPLSWIKPAAPTAKYYPAAFSAVYQAVGSVYNMPNSPGVQILNLTKGELVFAGGNLSQNFTNSVTLGFSSHIINQSANGLSMSFSLSTGTFSGKVSDPVSGTTYPFSGALLQKLNAGYGLLIGPSQSSSVSFSTAN